MSYLSLQTQVREAEQNLAEEIYVSVISDMPLTPWFELYLQLAWAKLGKKAVIKHIGWADRQTAEGLCILWPSSEAWQEITENEPAGIWVGPESYTHPLRPFYGAIWQEDKKHINLQPTLDLSYLMAKIGLNNCLAQEERRFGDIYSKALQQQVAEAAVRFAEVEKVHRKKCVILDLDGVLWGGILSEDGIDGIQLSENGRGQFYYEFQKLLKRLKDHGILLAVCSKNDDEEVRSVFREHTAMRLSEEDIAAWSVCFENKSEQIEKLSNNLGIDVQDMVFVDDHEWEIAEVQNRFPEIAGVLFTPETVAAELAHYLWLLPEDQNEQNILRMQTYQDNQKREVLRREAGSYEEFLKQLNTKVRMQKAKPADIPRISDLSRRVNQAGNGKRYSKEELKAMLQKGYDLTAIFVEDVYRDLGLVGCIGMWPKEGVLDLFALSCRALGRHIEQELLDKYEGKAHYYQWIDTGKNAWLKELFDEKIGEEIHAGRA